MFDLRNEIKSFQFPCLYCDDYSVFASAGLISLKRIQELRLIRIRENGCPLAQNLQKILNSGIHKHCSTKTLRIREKNPAVWYSNNVRQPVITPNALSQSIK
jgi:hypothetical protein